MAALVIKDSRSQLLFARRPPARRRVQVVHDLNATITAGFSPIPASAGDPSCGCFFPGSGSLLAPTNSFTLAQAANAILLLAVTNQCGDPVSLVGASLTFSAKDCLNDEFPRIFKTSADPLQINIFDAPNGKAYIYLVPDDTRNKGPGKFLYDVWLTLSTGESFPIILSASFMIVRSVFTPP